MMLRSLTRRLVLLVSIVAAVAPTFSSAANSSGTMTVRGRFLYTAAGERVVLRGVNEMFAHSPDPTGARTMPEIARTGANAVRIMTALDYPAASLDAILGHAVANGMIPIAECHAATGKWEKLDDCVAYWTRPDIAAVVRRHRRWVLVNIANEAGATVPAADFVAGYRDAIARIRAAGIDVPLIVDGSDWGKEYAMLLDSWAPLNASDPARAVMVSAHSYWVGTEEERRAPYRAIVARVTRDNIPFLLGEGPTSAGWDCKASPYRWAMGELQRAEIGWLTWSWGMVPNGDCRAEKRYDVTDGGRFGRWKSEAGEALMISDPASVRNTSRRPCSIPNAGANCVRPERPARKSRA
ncbi:glycoside hydrolase family 5 protein [Sphingomonas sp. PL-96]|uniref:cellulase family glycosylhydrolase n=1 Tax=Sphingomonas sp. PL-96 TaxID=2887201 RepID=UPI001E401B02|nr:cellulase family glycosylhydrolase [Sphingomonas sp. PL-96]MCC2977085.1 glycoside hydrolase family 5 protein [Sphingomonas sp. PL-96]